MLGAPDITVWQPTKHDMAQHSTQHVACPTMLVLIFISAVACEWVEISQQHYRKPTRTIVNKLTGIEDPGKTYTNNSLHYIWNPDANKLPNSGIVKHIHADRTQEEVDEMSHVGTATFDRKVTLQPERTFGLKDTQRKQTEIMHVSTNLEKKNDQFNYDSKVYIPNRYSSDNIRNVAEDTVKGTVQRVSNVGTVRRVQLANSPVKSPTSKHKPTTLTIPSEHSNENPNDLTTIHNRNTKITDKGDLNKHVRATEETLHSNTRVSESFDNFSRVISIDRPQFVTEEETNLHNNYFKDIETPQTKLSLPSANKEGEFTENYVYVSNIHTVNNAAFSKEDIRQDHKGFTREGGPKIPNDNKPTKAKETNSSDDHTHSKHEDSVKQNTMENVLKFMKIVADTISKNTRRSFGSKIKYLHELKRTILANIEERIDSTWPDDSSEAADRNEARRHSRTKRGESLAESRGHVEFPSSESALMTISFLTFAVFLIKLVLQVIQTYKNKTMLVAPLVVATARRRNKRAHD